MMADPKKEELSRDMRDGGFCYFLYQRESEWSSGTTWRPNVQK